MLIFLLGFMGSGKSFCGKTIASAYGVSFYDLDKEIETLHKKSIEELFATEGEFKFRTIESSALKDLVLRTAVSDKGIDAVVSCGGGTPCFHDNMQFMNEKGLTVWLNPPLETIIGRLVSGKSHRPLIKNLKDEELGHYIEHKLKERKVFYEKAKLHYHGNACALEEINNYLKNE